MSEQEPITIDYKKERDTSNYRRFQEVTSNVGSPTTCGPFYLHNRVLDMLGNPERVRITVEVIED